MARNTRIYTDIDLNFTPNPSTGDVAVKYDDQAIKQSVKTLVMTQFYERPFHPEIGSQVYGLLFEPMSPILQSMIETAITNTIANHEPRVTLIRVDVNMDSNNNAIAISITFRINNTTTPLNVDFTLYRSR